MQGVTIGVYGVVVAKGGVEGDRVFWWARRVVGERVAGGWVCGAGIGRAWSLIGRSSDREGIPLQLGWQRRHRQVGLWLGR